VIPKIVNKTEMTYGAMERGRLARKMIQAGETPALHVFLFLRTEGM